MIRVYYNKRGPLPWLLDWGSFDTAINVQNVVIEGVHAESRYDASNKDPNKPTGWLEIQQANVQISGGTAKALITP